MFKISWERLYEEEISIPNLATEIIRPKDAT
jgi:hypothetical protein